MGLTPLPGDEIATIVTTLEMTKRPAPRPLLESPLQLVAWPTPDPAKYRALFRRVGAPWLWFSRLVMDDAALTRIIHDPAVAVFAVLDRRGIEVGMLELDFRSEGACELAYVGLVPELTGLMGHALMRAWAKGVARVWVHTCTLDHPSALGFYRAAGFVPVSRTIETFVDPRVAGLLPADTAPQIPLLAPIRR
jgi:GNAT superfamily N-acetyltransferase